MTQVAGFADLMAALQQADFFTGLLPFVIIYSVFYIALINAPKFEESQRITTLVAASFGFLGAFFVLQSPFYQTFFIDYLGFLAVGLLGVIGLMTALMLTGFKDWFGIGPGDDKNKVISYGIGAIALLAVVSAFVAAGGFGTRPTGPTGAVAGLFNLFAYIVNTGLIWGLVILIVLAIGFGSENTGDDGGDGS